MSDRESADASLELESVTDDCLLTGVDLVSVERIESLLAEFGQSFRDRCFTEVEQHYCEHTRHPAEHYAARWAAKEAFLKCLERASPDLPLRSIEVTRTRAGPTLTLYGPARTALSDRLEARGCALETADRSVSLSHDRASGVAIAHVVVRPRLEVADTVPEGHR